MRVDGRAYNALRPFRIELGFTRYAEGSVLVTQGNTIVLCNATLEEEKLPAWLEQSAAPRGWVTAEYAMLPRSTHTRNPRETTPRGRTQEISRLLGRSLRAAVTVATVPSGLTPGAGPFRLTTTGTLPDGLLTGTDYYAAAGTFGNGGDDYFFGLSLSYANAVAGIYDALDGGGGGASGTHTLTAQPGAVYYPWSALAAANFTVELA